MRRQRTDLKIGEVVRCARCHRVCRKELAVKANGLWYGSECKSFALAAAEDAERLARGELD